MTKFKYEYAKNEYIILSYKIKKIDLLTSIFEQNYEYYEYDWQMPTEA